MTKLPIAPTEVPPIWKGRRGWINTGVCCVLALACAVGLLLLVERSVVVPACSAYASKHEMTYKDFKLTGLRTTSNVVCVLAKANGKMQDIHLRELVSYVTDFLVGIAMSLEFTVPLLAIFFAIMRLVWYRRTGL
jgi:hypothetical protein